MERLLEILRRGVEQRVGDGPADVVDHDVEATELVDGAVGEAEDVAAAVLYLSSPAGGYLTGKVLEVDGGLDQPNLDLGLPDLTPEGS